MDSDKTLYCLIRKSPLASLPEEIVRQNLIKDLLNLGYPASGFALEKKLSQMPHLALSSEKLPDRRADIVVFGKGIHPNFDLYPLLLVECKAVPLTDKVIHQATGYNYYLKSYFILLANQEKSRFGWYSKEKKGYTFLDNHIPTYEELIGSVKI